MTTNISKNSSEEKLDFKRILPIFIIVLIDLLGLTVIIPLMPFYAAKFQADAFTIGLLGATYPIFQFIGAPLLGRISDRYGRKPVLIISQLGTFIGFLILGFANTLWVLFLARLIDGISGANLSTAQAAISDSTSAKNRTQGLGLIGAAFGIGFILGPIIAFVALSLSNNNYSIPAFVAAGFSALSILLSWFLFHESLPEEKRGKGTQKPSFTLVAMLQALRRPYIGVLLILIFSQQIVFGGFQQMLALFTLGRLGLNASGNSIIFVFVGLIIVIMQGGLIGRLSRKYGDRKLIYFGLALLAVGLTLLAFTPRQPLPGYSKAALSAEISANPNIRTHEHPVNHNLTVELPEDTKKGWLGIGWLLVAMVPSAMGGSLLNPAINSLITRQVVSDEVGGILGISAAFLSGANAIAPVVMGAAFQAWGSTVAFFLGGMVMAILLVFALRMIQPGKGETTPAGLPHPSTAN
jgi:DHA1 family tetracycline resistance protein-like MFS transporter